MRSKILLFSLLIASLLLTLQSCDPPTAKKTVSITTVGYVIENVPADYWSATDANPHSLFYEFWIDFAGNISASDIESATISVPNSPNVWDITSSKDLYFDKGYLYCRATYGDGPCRELPIGKMTATITLTNKEAATKDFTMGIPGSTSPDPYYYVYCKEDKPTPEFPAASMPALMRPAVTGFTKPTDSTVAVTFTINGSNVANGYIWFYDSNDNYLGVSKYFRDAKSGATSSSLANTTFNNSDGGNNVMTLSAADIVDSNDAALSATAFSNIQKCRVVVVDGAQHSGSGYMNYDYRARSPMFSIQ